MCNWKKVSLSEVCSIFDGPHATPKKQNSGKIFLGISSLNFTGRINPQFFEYISGDDFKKWTKRVLPQHNDIVFSYETKLGTAALIPLGFECCLGRRMGLLRANSNIDARFLLYTYLSPYFQNIISENTNSGSTVDRIPLTELPNFKIYLPPLAEQKAIAAVLGSLDDKIDLLHRQNATLERMAETLFRQWFIEEAQEDWEETTIGNIVEIKGGSTPSTKQPELWNGDIYWTSPRDIANLNSIFLFSTERTISEKGLEKISSGLLPKGTLLLSSRAPIGYLAITEIELAINQGYIAILHNNNIPNYYMFLWCKCNMETIKAAGNGSVFQEISKSVFRSLPFRLPPLDLMKKFQQIIEPIFQKIRLNQQQIQTLEKLRDTLLPKLMSGEVRVRVDE